jgi:hypothetical protein
MLLLFFINCAVIADSPPPLPTDDSSAIEATKVKTANDPQESQSFFEKIKSFFGFKKTPVKITEQKVVEQDITQDEQSQDSQVMKIGDNKLPILQESDASTISQLELPSGFQEENTERIAVKDVAQEEPKTTITTPQTDAMVTPTNQNLPLLEPSDHKDLLQEQGQSEAIAVASPQIPTEEIITQLDKVDQQMAITKSDESKNTLVEVQSTSSNQNLSFTKLSNDKAVIATKDLGDNAETNVPSISQQDILQSDNPAPQVTQSQPTNIIDTKPLEEKPVITSDEELSVSDIEESAQNSKPATVKPRKSAKLIVPQNLPISRARPITPRVEQKIISKKATDNVDYDDLGDDEDNNDERAKFVSDEAKVLLLPNDDIVLGLLSEKADHELMDISKYLHLFEKSQTKQKETEKRIIMKTFLANYEDNFYIKPSKIELSEAFHESMNAVGKNNLFVLRALLDNYEILQRKNQNNDNLLHHATSLNNYSLAKFLIMRGIDTGSFNNYHETPLAIANMHGNMFIINMIKRAQYKQ